MQGPLHPGHVLSSLQHTERLKLGKQPQIQRATSSPPTPVKGRTLLHQKETHMTSPRIHSTLHSPGSSMGTTSKPHGSTRPRFLPTGAGGLLGGEESSQCPHLPALHDSKIFSLHLTLPHRCCCRHHCSAQPLLQQCQLLCLLQPGAQLQHPPGEPSSSVPSSLFCLGQRNQRMRGMPHCKPIP